MEHEVNLKTTMSRLVITEEQQKTLDETLDTLLNATQGRSVMLIERSGLLLSSFGSEMTNNIAISSLIAGLFKSISALSALMGESEIRTMQHRGASTNLILNLLDTGDILAVQLSPAAEPGSYENPIMSAIDVVAPILVEARESAKKNTPYFGKDSIALILGKL